MSLSSPSQTFFVSLSFLLEEGSGGSHLPPLSLPPSTFPGGDAPANGGPGGGEGSTEMCCAVPGGDVPSQLLAMCLAVRACACLVMAAIYHVAPGIGGARPDGGSGAGAAQLGGRYGSPIPWRAAAVWSPPPWRAEWISYTMWASHDSGVVSNTIAVARHPPWRPPSLPLYHGGMCRFIRSSVDLARWALPWPCLDPARRRGDQI